MVSEQDLNSYMMVLLVSKLERRLHVTSMVNLVILLSDGALDKINQSFRNVMKEVPHWKHID